MASAIIEGLSKVDNRFPHSNISGNPEALLLFESRALFSDSLQIPGNVTIFNFKKITADHFGMKMFESSSF